MSGIISRGMVFGGTAVATLLASSLVISALGQPPSPPNQESIPTPAPASAAPASPASLYTGSTRCVECHREQAQAWGQTRHVDAFKDMPVQYRADPACLVCHITGYGKPGGYMAGTAQDVLKDLLEVGCEACHGPGNEHEAAARELTKLELSAEQLEQLDKKMRATIQKVMPGNACVGCHVTPEGHQPHPFYVGQPARPYPGRGVLCLTSRSGARIPARKSGPEAAPPAGQVYVGMKPCESCHYLQFEVWRTTRHAIALTDMPPKYWSDPQCLQCHMTGYGASGGYTAATDPGIRQNLLAVTCEACHGPGSQHARYAKQFISPCSLGPQLEQSVRDTIYAAGPGNMCVTCHVRQGHKEHPHYDQERPLPHDETLPPLPTSPL